MKLLTSRTSVLCAAMVMSLGFAPAMSFAANLNHTDWIAKSFSDGSKHGAEKWSQLPGKVGEAATARRATSHDQGITFYGQAETAKGSTSINGYESSGYGVIDSGWSSKSGDKILRIVEADHSVSQFPLADGGVAEVEMNGMFKSLSNRNISEVTSRYSNGRGETVNMSVTSGTGVRGRLTKTFENTMKDAYVVERVNGQFVTQHYYSAVESGTRSISASKYRSQVAIEIYDGEKSFHLRLNPEVKGEIIEVDTKISGRVKVSVLDSEGALHTTIYQVDPTDLAIDRGLGSFNAKATKVGETAVVKNAVESLGLQANIKVYPGATQVPAGGSVQGLRVNTSK